MIDVAAGDTIDNPYIVHNWTEFNDYNSNNTGKYIKFANFHVDGSGNITIVQGTGTSDNPYVVSTYDEMLYITGATEVWQCKLIDTVDMIYAYKYIVDYDELFNPIYNTVYCKYDSIPTTIDFSAAGMYPTGMSRFLCPNDIDFNGWTLLNLLLTVSSHSSQSDSSAFYCSSTSLWFRKAIVLNCEVRSKYVINIACDQCIFHINWYPPIDTWSWFLCTRSGERTHMKKCTLFLKAVKATTGGGTAYNLSIGGDTGGNHIDDCIFDLDLDIPLLEKDSGYTRGLITNRSIIRGSTTASQQETGLIYTTTSSIVDFKTPNRSVFNVSGYSSSGVSVCVTSGAEGYKPMQFASSGWKAISYQQLFDPEYLQSLGFPIGVDT